MQYGIRSNIRKPEEEQIVPPHFKEIIMLNWFKKAMGITPKRELAEQEDVKQNGTTTSPVVIKAAPKKTRKKTAPTKKKATKKAKK